VAIERKAGINKGKFFCSYCDRMYDMAKKADRCLAGHDLLYVPLSASDIDALHKFLYFKDEKVLTSSLWKQIKRYAKIASKRSSK
jgi:hypothetical protein